MSKVSAKALEASNLLARLRGMDTSTIVNKENNTDIDIEFEDEPRRTKRSTTKKTKTAKAEVVKKQSKVPDLEIFNALHRNDTLIVQQMSHDIHYKEQIWDIPSRAILYNLEVVSIPKIATDIAKMFGMKSTEDARQATSGEVRYIRIVSYENIPYRSKEIGYIRVESVDGNLKAKLLLKSTQMKENNINPDKVKKSLNKQMDKLLGKLDKE